MGTFALPSIVLHEYQSCISFLGLHFLRSISVLHVGILHLISISLGYIFHLDIDSFIMDKDLCHPFCLPFIGGGEPG